MEKNSKNQTIILKIGGSIITKKFSSRPQIKEKKVRQLAKELKLFTRRFPKTKIILLHGAGSFGHPLVYKYKLLKQPLTGPRLLGFAKTICSTRQLANLLTEIFADAKLPVLPLQASAMSPLNLRYLKQMLETGFIPLLGGDIGLTKQNQSILVSADKLAVVLAKAFPNSRVIFATDVNGVFDKFPTSDNANPIPLLSRKGIKSMLKKMSEKNTRYDVTGGMAGKLKTILVLKNKEIVVFNGLKSGNLIKALTGGQIGTRLIL